MAIEVKPPEFTLEDMINEFDASEALVQDGAVQNEADQAALDELRSEVRAKRAMSRDIGHSVLVQVGSSLEDPSAVTNARNRGHEVSPISGYGASGRTY